MKPPPVRTPTVLYRIRRKSDGKYSTGTTSPRWTANGKYFVNRGALRDHLKWFFSGPHTMDLDGDIIRLNAPKPNPDDYEVIEYSITEKLIFPLDPEGKLGKPRSQP